MLFAGVFVLGRRVGGWRTASVWLTLCALGPTVIEGVCSAHMIPIAMLVWALVFLGRPVVSGMLLGLAAATLFYPVFAIPLWFGWYLRSKRRDAWRFAAGVIVVGLVTLGGIIALTDAPTPLAAVETFLKDTVLMQEGAEAYGGLLRGGFWGCFPTLRQWLRLPLMVAYFAACLILAGWPAIREKRQLALLTAAAFLGILFWKSHVTGYAEWYFYLACIGLFWPAQEAKASYESSVGKSPDRSASVPITT